MVLNSSNKAFRKSAVFALLMAIILLLSTNVSAVPLIAILAGIGAIVGISVITLIFFFWASVLAWSGLTLRGMMYTVAYFTQINPCVYAGSGADGFCNPYNTGWFKIQLPVDPTIKTMNNNFLALMYPFYLIAIILVAIYVILLSTSPSGRSRGKDLLVRLAVGMIFVSLSPVLFQLMLNVTNGISYSILDEANNQFPTVVNSMISSAGGFKKFVIYIVMLIASLFVAIITVGRYLVISFLAAIFPLTLFLYFFSYTRGLGTSLLKFTFLIVLIQLIQVIILAVTVLSAAASNDFWLTMFISGGGIVGLVVTPLIGMRLLAWLGAITHVYSTRGGAPSTRFISALMMVAPKRGLFAGISEGIMRSSAQWWLGHNMGAYMRGPSEVKDAGHWWGIPGVGYKEEEKSIPTSGIHGIRGMRTGGIRDFRSGITEEERGRSVISETTERRGYPGKPPEAPGGMSVSGAAPSGGPSADRTPGTPSGGAPSRPSAPAYPEVPPVEGARPSARLGPEGPRGRAYQPIATPTERPLERAPGAAPVQAAERRVGSTIVPGGEIYGELEIARLRDAYEKEKDRLNDRYQKELAALSKGEEKKKADINAAYQRELARLSQNYSQNISQVRADAFFNAAEKGELKEVSSNLSKFNDREQAVTDLKTIGSGNPEFFKGGEKSEAAGVLREAVKMNLEDPNLALRELAIAASERPVPVVAEVEVGKIPATGFDLDVMKAALREIDSSAVSVKSVGEVLKNVSGEDGRANTVQDILGKYGDDIKTVSGDRIWNDLMPEQQKAIVAITGLSEARELTRQYMNDAYEAKRKHMWEKKERERWEIWKKEEEERVEEWVKKEREKRGMGAEYDKLLREIGFKDINSARRNLDRLSPNEREDVLRKVIKSSNPDQVLQEIADKK